MVVCGVKSLWAPYGKSFCLREASEILSNFSQGLVVDIDLVPEFTQIGDYAFGRRIGYSIARRTRSALHRTYSPVRCIHVNQFAETDRAVGVEFQRLVSSHRLDCWNHDTRTQWC